MSVTAKTLISARFTQDAVATEYTVPDGSTIIIDKFTATNIDASARTITIYLVPAGASPTDSNMVIQAHSIAAGATQDFSSLQNQILSENDSIQIVASVIDTIVIRASGREVT